MALWRAWFCRNVHLHTSLANRHNGSCDYISSRTRWTKLWNRRGNWQVLKWSQEPVKVVVAVSLAVSCIIQTRAKSRSALFFPFVFFFFFDFIDFSLLSKPPECQAGYETLSAACIMFTLLRVSLSKGARKLWPVSPQFIVPYSTANRRGSLSFTEASLIKICRSKCVFLFENHHRGLALRLSS